MNKKFKIAIKYNIDPYGKHILNFFLSETSENFHSKFCWNVALIIFGQQSGLFEGVFVFVYEIPRWLPLQVNILSNDPLGKSKYHFSEKL
jgi:hypothetical protein